MVTSSGGVGAELGEDCAVEVCRRRDPLGGGGVDGGETVQARLGR